ncbi:MAG TPA: LacI family DNA-binding transcriptional regulator, partial [bacterium]|nr:LacI family DNA-binding transcriptional regulator [bacterium]
MSELIRGIDEEVFELGGHINLCLSNDSYEREAEILIRLTEQGTRRILLFMVLSNEFEALNPNLPLYLNLQERGVRLLLMDCSLPHVAIPSIRWDDHGGMFKLVAHMAERGCRHLAYIGRRNNATTTSNRYQGFKDALLEYGLPFDASRVKWASTNGTPSLTEKSRDAAIAWFQKPQTVDAVLCSDEEVAAGVFEALEVSPNVSPDRMVIGGFGSAKSGILAKNDRYVLLDQDTYLLGKIAAEAVVEKSGESDTPARWGFQRVLDVPIRIPRKSPALRTNRRS